MNFLGRIFLLLLTILVIVLLTVFLLSPSTIGDWSGNISEISPVFRVVVAVLLDLVLLVLLFIQFRPARQPVTTGLMMRATGTVTEVSVESARDRILKAVSDVPDVVSVDAQVKPIHGRAEIELNVEVLGEDVRLPDKQKEIDRALKQVINKQLGLQMAGRPRVHIRLHGERVSIARPGRVEVPPVTPLPELERKEPVSAQPMSEPISESEEAVTVKPVESLPPRVVETKPEPREGLFGGLFRNREQEEAAPPAAETTRTQTEEEALFADTPELAALLRPTPEETKPDEPASVVAETQSVVEAEINKADSSNLDQAIEPSNADADDLINNRSDTMKDSDMMEDDEVPASSDSEETDKPRQSDMM